MKKEATLEEQIKKLEKQANNYYKRTKLCAGLLYASLVFLGLSLFVGLPIGLIAEIPALAIASGAIAGLQVVTQCASMAVGAYFNGKAMDVEDKKEKLLQEMDSTKSVNFGNEITDEVSVADNKISKKRTKKVQAEKNQNRDVTVD